jgi:uncharacterized protein (TIGR03089 family)
VLGTALPAEAERPVLIYCDDVTGERTELSVRALSGLAAQTAGLLHAGCGLSSGDRAAVLLPPHWQTAGVLLGAWAAGVAVSYRPWGTAGLPLPGPGSGRPLAASFVSAARLRSWLDDPPAATHRFVLGLGDAIPEDAGYRDFLAEASQYSDNLPAYAPLSWTDAASADGTTYREWGAIAAGIAGQLGLRAGDRLLVDAASFEQPLHWLLAPLAAGASVVLCANFDRSRLDARIETEGVTHVLM